MLNSEMMVTNAMTASHGADSTSDQDVLNLADVIRKALDDLEQAFIEEAISTSVHKSTKRKLDPERRANDARRNRKILEMHLGLYGQPSLSLEQIGASFASIRKARNADYNRETLTRERVRQIINKSAQLLRDLPNLPIDAFRQAFSIIKSMIPANRLDVQRRMQNLGYWDNSMPIDNLLSFGDLVICQKSDDRIISLKDDVYDYLLLKSQAGWPKILQAAAVRLVSHNGAASLKQIVEWFSSSEYPRRRAPRTGKTRAPRRTVAMARRSELDLKVLRQFLDASECIWLDDDKTWLTVANTKRNRLRSRVEKIFSFYKRVELKNLALAISRSMKIRVNDYYMELPLNILERLINTMHGLKVVDGVVIAEEGVFSTPISVVELSIAEYACSAPGGVCREKELELAVINTISRRISPDDQEAIVTHTKPLKDDEPRISEYEFSMALSFSPLVIPLTAPASAPTGATEEPLRVRGCYLPTGTRL